MHLKRGTGRRSTRLPTPLASCLRPNGREGEGPLSTKKIRSCYVTARTMPDLSVKVDRHDIVGIGIGLSLVWLLATFTWFFQHLSEANGPRTVGMNFTLPLIYRFE